MFGRELFGVEREREIRNNYVIIMGRQLFGYERKGSNIMFGRELFGVEREREKLCYYKKKIVRFMREREN